MDKSSFIKHLKKIFNMKIYDLFFKLEYYKDLLLILIVIIQCCWRR